MSAHHMPISGSGYVGRFAPSPTGPLHAGSLVAAMASYLDARAHRGKWLVRMEDVDMARTVPGAAESIMQTLAAFGMHADGEVMVQSKRGVFYEAAFERLRKHVYPCGCSRREIADSSSGTGVGSANSSSVGSGIDSGIDPGIDSAIASGIGWGIGSGSGPRIATAAASETQVAVYPGTCRNGLAPGKKARAWRLRVPAFGEAGEYIVFDDRACGRQTQHLASEAGDFVLRRADGFWAYQLAVVVDDGAQGVTHVVRGMDLLDSTPRQMHLQRLLGLPTPRYLHAPLVRNPNGEKLSKQTGATALDLARVELALADAAQVLGLGAGLAASQFTSPAQFWERAVPVWAALHHM